MNPSNNYSTEISSATAGQNDPSSASAERSDQDSERLLTVWGHTPIPSWKEIFRSIYRKLFSVHMETRPLGLSRKCSNVSLKE